MRDFSPIRSILLIALACVSSLGSIGCAGSDNPLAPGGETGPIEEETFTPVSLRITSVDVTAFGGKSGDGDWDWTYGSAPAWPDVYVTLHQGSTGNSPIYVSTVADDAVSGVRYEFSASPAGTGLPKTVPASSTLALRMMDDDDGALGDDFMGSASFRPASSHDGSNKRSFYRSVNGSNATKFTVHGEWIY